MKAENLNKQTSRKNKGAAERLHLEPYVQTLVSRVARRQQDELYTSAPTLVVNQSHTQFTIMF